MYLDDTLFEIPNSCIIGILPYKYTKTANNFELTFYQNVLFYFNFEIVTYNNRKEHKAEGELKTLYKTFDDNWKYYVFD